jgi:hypothetical protein
MMKKNLLLIAAFLFLLDGYGQELRLRLGTEFPLQHYIGVNYQFNPKFSADLSYGIVDSPYNNELYDWINVPSKFQSRKEFLQELTDDGSVVAFGGNFHKNKWYFGLHFQYIQLNASGSYDQILNNDLVQEELSSSEQILLDSVLTLLRSPIGSFVINLDNRVAMETSLFQMGLKVGRQFQFKNPKWSMNIELGLTANLHATTETYYDRNLLNRIEFLANTQFTGSSSEQILENLNFDERGEQVNEFFRDYGYIPGLRIGFSYLLYKKEK